MAVIMGAAMAVIMLAFMLKMYTDRRINPGVSIGSVSQAIVGDIAYMRGMIPHHSIAILASERAHIMDPRVRRLPDQIIESQRKEIAEMKTLIEGLEHKR